MTDPTPSAPASHPNGIDPTLPEPVRRFLAMGARLEQIRLDADGRWWHEGEPFENPKLIRLFSRSVDRTEGGTWVLHIAPFTYPIEVDDTGFFVRAARVDADQGRALLDLSDGTTEALDPATLTYQDGRGFVCRIRDGRFRARFLRRAYYALSEHLEPDPDDPNRFILALGDTRIPLTFDVTDD